MSHPDHQANSETVFTVCRKVRMATPDVSEAQLRLVENGPLIIQIKAAK